MALSVPALIPRPARTRVPILQQGGFGGRCGREGRDSVRFDEENAEYSKK